LKKKTQQLWNAQLGAMLSAHNWIILLSIFCIIRSFAIELHNVIIDLDASAFVSTGLDIDDDLALLYLLSSPKV
jgi:hypothetical protein